MITSPRPFLTPVSSLHFAHKNPIPYVTFLDSEKPEEWDDEEDGEWVAPQIRNPKCDEAPGCGEWKRPFKSNPAYKGKWYAPMIDNPAYKGEWAPRKIDNPAYFEDKNPISTLNKIVRILSRILFRHRLTLVITGWRWY